MFNQKIKFFTRNKKVLLNCKNIIFNMSADYVPTKRSTFMYFAYGSNLWTNRIHLQNPSAIRRGTAVLKVGRKTNVFIWFLWMKLTRFSPEKCENLYLGLPAGFLSTIRYGFFFYFIENYEYLNQYFNTFSVYITHLLILFQFNLFNYQENRQYGTVHLLQ